MSSNSQETIVDIVADIRAQIALMQSVGVVECAIGGSRWRTRR